MGVLGPEARHPSPKTGHGLGPGAGGRRAGVGFWTPILTGEKIDDRGNTDTVWLAWLGKI